jgi:ABC-2 type transport system permease protein
MNSFLAVFKRELKSYFTTPLAYVFLIVFLVASAYYTFEKQHFFEMRQADMTAFFINLPLLFILIIPATAMRLWAEERKAGTIELLFTLPVTVTQAVLGKFFAAWIFLAIALALTFPMVITVFYLGDPDIGQILTGYLGSFLMAGGYLAIGCFFSSISKNQVIAFVLSVVACAILGYSDAPSSQRILYDFFGGILVVGIRFVSHITQFSVRGHFELMLRGVLGFRDISYFLILIVGWITACTFILYNRKAS